MYKGLSDDDINAFYGVPIPASSDDLVSEMKVRLNFNNTFHIQLFLFLTRTACRLSSSCAMYNFRIVNSGLSCIRIEFRVFVATKELIVGASDILVLNIGRTSSLEPSSDGISTFLK